ncbi:MAG: energy-coupling factor transporter transmembrane protein EcfT, partial [Candidatus Eremiobacteraeota bacterium]|nr:energy-coupling factor transporter transmembrane protein EcfT [Candidatus Eremiobacteraeota bacterium]
MVGSLVMLTLFLVERWQSLGLLSAFCLGLVLISGVGAAYFLRGLKAIAVVALLTLLFHAALPGPKLSHWQGLENGAHLALRLFLLVALSSLLTLTTRPLAAARALEGLLKPLGWVGLPVADLSLMSLLSLRFLPILALEADRVVKAQLSRGAPLDHGSWLARWRAMRGVLVPIFVRALHHADHMALAMEARGYRGGQPRSQRCPLTLTVADWAFGFA